MLGKTECLDVLALTEAVKEQLLLRRRRSVQECDNRALMEIYGSDDTPMTTRERIQVYVPATGWVTRRGRKPNEFCIERQATMWRDENENVHTSACLRDPLSMVHGKGVWPHFATVAKNLACLWMWLLTLSNE